MASTRRRCALMYSQSRSLCAAWCSVCWVVCIDSRRGAAAVGSCGGASWRARGVCRHRLSFLHRGIRLGACPCSGRNSTCALAPLKASLVSHMMAIVPLLHECTRRTRRAPEPARDNAAQNTRQPVFPTTITSKMAPNLAATPSKLRRILDASIDSYTLFIQVNPLS